MKATLNFDLPDDSDAFDAAVEAMASVQRNTTTLTDAEREAVCVAMNRCEGAVYRTLRDLLERT